MADKSTPINSLKKIIQNAPPMPQNTSETDVVENNQMPGNLNLAHQPQPQPQPHQGQPHQAQVQVQGQGHQSAVVADKPNVIREFFKNSDQGMKSAVLVFALVLIFTSSIFISTVGTHIPGIVSDGRVTLLGTFLSAVLIALVYLVIRMVMKI